LSAYQNEVARFFPEENISFGDESYSLNDLPISFSALNIKTDGQQVLKNDFNFNQYLNNEISGNVLDRTSYEFSKICSYFTLNRDFAKISSYEYNTLLDKNLFYNSLSVYSVENAEIKIPRQKYSVVKKDNVDSYISFPSSLSNDACTDSITTQETNNPNSVPELAIRDRIPENLFNNITVNSTFTKANTYATAYTIKPTEYTTTTGDSIPVQVIYPYSQFLQRTNTLFKEAEPVVANSKLFSIFYTNFKLVGVVEYLSDLTDGMYARWLPLTIANLNLLSSKRMLCRVNFYTNNTYEISEQSFDAFSIYNRYFYLEA
jgi:hypothetical protein